MSPTHPSFHFNDYVVPLLWRAAESALLTPERDYRPFFQAALEDTDRHSLVQSFAQYLIDGDTPVELSSLVRLDDDGEARFLDTIGPLLKSLLVALSIDSRLRRTDLTELGSRLRHSRADLDRHYGSLLESTALTFRTLRDELAAAHAALVESIGRAERREYEALLEKDVESNLLDGIRIGVQEAVRGDFPRRLVLGENVNYSQAGRIPWRQHTVRARLPRQMLVEPSGSDQPQLVDSLAEMLVRWETAVLEQLLRRSRRRTFGLPAVHQRVIEAVSQIPSGEEAFLLVPFDWTTIEGLRQEGILALDRTRGDDEIGRIGDVPVIRAPFSHDDSLHLITNRRALSVTVHGEPADWLRIRVEDLTANEANQSMSYPELVLALEERLAYRMAHRHHVRIAGFTEPSSEI